MRAKNKRWTIGELRRAHELAVVVGLPTGSIAKLLEHEYGTTRTGDAVRRALRTHFDWRGTPHGDPATLKRPR